MAKTKNYPELNKHTVEAADLLSVLGHRKRILILNTILHDEMSVTALSDVTELTQSALSQHLMKLRQQGLVSTRRDGQTVYYRVSSPRVAPMLKMLTQLFTAN